MFSQKEVEIGKPIDVIGVDVNENNVTIAKLHGFEKKLLGRKILELLICLNVEGYSLRLKVEKLGGSF